VPLRHRGQQHAHSHLLDELLTPCRSVENRPILTPLFRHCRVERKIGRIRCVKRYWEIVADNLSKAGWSWGCVATVDSRGRTIWVVAAERSDAGRFIVHADEKLTAFMELESAIQPSVRKIKTNHRLVRSFGVSGNNICDRFSSEPKCRGKHS
jgi:hypothetical protein